MSTNGQKSEGGNATNRLVDSVDQMVRWPFQMTGATWDLMMQSMRAVTGSSGRESTSASSPWLDRGAEHSSGPSWTAMFTGQSDQDLSGDDLKYVIWSIVFTKPGLECVLEPQHEEIVNYSADGASFAAVKIAKFLEKARHGHAEKPAGWHESGYAVETHHKASERRSETTTVISAPAASAGGKADASGQGHERGWRIPSEDQKYIKFLYRVDRRLPKQDAEVIERVTIERNTTKMV